MNETEDKKDRMNIIETAAIEMFSDELMEKIKPLLKPAISRISKMLGEPDTPTEKILLIRKLAGDDKPYYFVIDMNKIEKFDIELKDEFKDDKAAITGATVNEFVENIFS